MPNRVPETTPSSIADSVQALIRKVNQAGIADEVPGQTFVEKRDGETFLVQIKAIKNELRCQACHTPPQEGNPNYALLQDRWKVRTIVTVSSPMTGIEKQITQNKRISILIGLVHPVLRMAHPALLHETLCHPAHLGHRHYCQRNR